MRRTRRSTLIRPYDAMQGLREGTHQSATRSVRCLDTRRPDASDFDVSLLRHMICAAPRSFPEPLRCAFAFLTSLNFPP